ncbi:MAG: hypothetical protein ABH863_05265 [Candidatus Micrarchaeota archaeon]
MGILEALGRLENVGIHPSAKKRLHGIRNEIREGNLEVIAQDPKNISALSLLGELTREDPQITTMAGNHYQQLERGRELHKHAKLIRPKDLAIFRRPNYLRALNSATEHSKFTIAAHAPGFAQYLRITDQETAAQRQGGRKFPKDAAAGYFALARAGIDPLLPSGQSRYMAGIGAIKRALHTSTWKMFGSNPEFFSRIAAIADLMRSEDLRRVLSRQPKIKSGIQGQEELFGKWESWEKVLHHPNLIEFLRIHRTMPGHHTVRERAPKIMEKIGRRKPLLANEKRALYAWIVKAIAPGAEGRDTMRERMLLRNFDDGAVDVEALARIKERLDGYKE